MAEAVAVFVSKRLQRASVALFCLTLAQATVSLSSCQPEPVPLAAVRAQGF